MKTLTVIANTTVPNPDREGDYIVLMAGEQWFADDPVVKRHRWAFGELPAEAVRGTVEQATAAPGELRVGVRRS